MDSSYTTSKNTDRLNQLKAYMIHAKKNNQDVDNINLEDRNLFKFIFEIGQDLKNNLMIDLPLIQEDSSMFEDKTLVEKFKYFCVSYIHDTINSIILEENQKDVTMNLTIFIKSLDDLYSNIEFTWFIINIITYDNIILNIQDRENTQINEILFMINKLDYELHTLVIQYLLDNMNDVFYIHLMVNVYELVFIYSSQNIPLTFWDIINHTIRTIKPTSLYLFDNKDTQDINHVKNKHDLYVPIIIINEPMINHLSDIDRSKKRNTNQQNTTYDELEDTIEQSDTSSIDDIPNQVVDMFEDMIEQSDTSSIDELPSQVIEVFEDMIKSSDSDTILSRDHLVNNILIRKYNSICLDLTRTKMSKSYICDIIDFQNIKFLGLPFLIVDNFNDSINTMELQYFFSMESIAFSIMSRVLNIVVQSRIAFINHFIEYIHKQHTIHKEFIVRVDSKNLEISNIISPQDINFIWFQSQQISTELNMEDIFNNTVDFKLNDIGREFDNLLELSRYFSLDNIYIESKDKGHRDAYLKVLNSDTIIQAYFNEPYEIEIRDYIDMINSIFLINWVNYNKVTFKVTENRTSGIQIHARNELNMDLFYNHRFYTVEITNDGHII